LHYVLNNLETDMLVASYIIITHTERNKMTLVRNGFHKYREQCIANAIKSRETLCLEWILRRCNLKWKHGASMEYLICMNMNECYEPNKNIIFESNCLFTLDNSMYNAWYPELQFEITKEKIERQYFMQNASKTFMMRKLIEFMETKQKKQRFTDATMNK